MSRKCLTWGSCSVEPFLSFSTSLWLDKGLVWLCHNVCTNSLIASISFISQWGNLPTKSQQSFPPGVCRFSLITEYFWKKILFNLSIWEVCERRWRCCVEFITSYSDKTWRAAQISLVQDVFLITLKEDWIFLTIWLLESELLTIFMPIILLTTTKQFDLNKHSNNWNLPIYPLDWKYLFINFVINSNHVRI